MIKINKNQVLLEMMIIEIGYKNKLQKHFNVQVIHKHNVYLINIHMLFLQFNFMNNMQNIIILNV